MAGYNTGNEVAFIEAQQYSQFILQTLDDGGLPDSWVRNVSDFGSGTTLNIKTVGDVTIQDVSEEVPMEYNRIDTGTVNLQITDYKGAAWSISDNLREDGSQIEALHAMHGMKATQAIRDDVETQFYSVANAAQTDDNSNTINGFNHRLMSQETNDVIALTHFRDMKLAFDKANVPMGGRIAIVDPVVEATLNGLLTQTSITNAFDSQFNGLVTEGFMRDHNFVRNIMGWNIFTSNKLPKGTFGGATAITGATTQDDVSGVVANIFMCVAGDQEKPIMRAWRRMPKVENDRNKKLKRDEFDVTYRLGQGAQRLDTIGVVLTSDSNV